MRSGTSIRVQVRPSLGPVFAGMQATAIQWTGDNVEAVKAVMGYFDTDENGELVILAEDGPMSVERGDWIVKVDDATTGVAPVRNSMFPAFFEVIT